MVSATECAASDNTAGGAGQQPSRQLDDRNSDVGRQRQQHSAPSLVRHAIGPLT